MKKDSIIRKRLSQDAGFTLIELLMVVIILGILAAVVIPQFSGSAEDAKISALKSNLNSIRSAIELYQVQHDGAYPGATIGTQLTQYTELDGDVSTSKVNDFKYGPYLKQGFPKNPFPLNSAKADQIYVDTETATIGTIGSTLPIENQDEGWIYVSQTGEFIANNADYDQY